MRWSFANIEAKQILGENPLQMMDSPVLVKENPIRQVFKCGKLYFKYDMRFFNGLKKEFRHAMNISAAGIPAVKHLAVSRHWLITQSAENTVELAAFVRENVPSREMLESLGNFINILKKNNLKHTDLHSGNILYDTVQNSFLLVDLCSANISSARWASDEKHYAHLVMELRRYLPRKELYPLLQICSQSSLEELFDKTLNSDTVQTLNSWQKRKSQILSGYKKFIRKQDDVIFAADAPTDINNSTEISGNGMEYMLLHHFLELNHIPHKRVYAVDGNTVYVEQDDTQSTPVTEEIFADFSERLAICGIASAPQDWCISNGKIKFINLDSALKQCGFSESRENR